MWVLVFVLVAGSAIGLFYYLRIVVAMFARPAEDAPKGASPAIAALAPVSGLVLAVLTLLLLWLGLYPAPLVRVIQSAIGSLI